MPAARCWRGHASGSWRRGSPRRGDGIEVIGTAAAAALAGAGCGRIGQELGVPASTVRGWLRRLRSRPRRCARTRWSSDDPGAVARLLDSLRKAGAEDQTAALAERAAAHVPPSTSGC